MAKSSAKARRNSAVTQKLGEFARDLHKIKQSVLGLSPTEKLQNDIKRLKKERDVLKKKKKKKAEDKPTYNIRRVPGHKTKPRDKITEYST